MNVINCHFASTPNSALLCRNLKIRNTMFSLDTAVWDVISQGKCTLQDLEDKSEMETKVRGVEALLVSRPTKGGGVWTWW